MSLTCKNIKRWRAISADLLLSANRKIDRFLHFFAKKFGVFRNNHHICQRHQQMPATWPRHWVCRDRLSSCLYLWKSVHSLCFWQSETWKISAIVRALQRWMLMQVVDIKLFLCVLVLYAFCKGVPMGCMEYCIYTRLAWVLRCLFSYSG